MTEDFKRELSNGWRISEPYRESKQTAYVKQVTEELLAIPRQKIPPTTVQPASTQATLDRDPALDALHWNRQTPLEWKAVPDADLTTEWGREKAVAARQLKPQEMLLIEDIRHKSRNTLGDSDSSSMDKEKRETAIQAFTYSKPAELTAEQLKRVTKLEEIVNTPLDPPKKPKKKTLLEKWFGLKEEAKGGKSTTNLRIKGNSIVYVRDDADTD